MKDQVQTRQDLLLARPGLRNSNSLACQYLYAAFSLKLAGEAGVTEAQAQLIDGWRRAIVGIAVQEMLHLGLASNLLTAIGEHRICGARIFRRAIPTRRSGSTSAWPGERGYLAPLLLF